MRSSIDLLARRHRAVVLAAALATGLLLMPARASAAFQPEDFDVRINMGPDSSSQQPQPSCTPQTDGSQLCTSDFSMIATGKQASGTVTHKSSGLSGSIDTLCDFDMHQHMVMRMAPGFAGSPQIVDISASGSQSCSWHMAFSDGSSLTGRISGNMSMTLVDPATSTVRISVHFDVDVVAGTGIFDQMVGSGSFAHDEQMQMPTTPPGGPPHSSGAYRSVAASGDSSPMNLKLRRGKPAVRIVSPGKSLKKTDSTPLHVVTVPGASCKAAASKGGRKLKLGGARASSNGSASFSGALAKQLGAGSAKLQVSCSYRVKKARGTTEASAPVTVS